MRARNNLQCEEACVLKMTGFSWLRLGHLNAKICTAYSVCGLSGSDCEVSKATRVSERAGGYCQQSGVRGR